VHKVWVDPFPGAYLNKDITDQAWERLEDFLRQFDFLSVDRADYTTKVGFVTIDGTEIFDD